MTQKSAIFESGKLDTALAALRSDDVLTQNEGAEAAVQIGSRAVSSLIAILDEPGSKHAPAMYALAQIGDARAAEVFLTGLQDAQERVRAYAAQGLVRIGDSRAVAACLQTINDGGDELHSDITPSVQALGQMGLRAVPPVLNLLTNENEVTRLHAQRALELILENRHGFVTGNGFPSREAEEAVRREWRANGDYNYAASTEKRAAAAAKWRLWLESASTERRD